MYIVTGGAGLIGSALLWELNNEGFTDILVVDNLASSEKWKNLVNRRFAEYMPREIFLEKINTDAIRDDIDGIFHMGACSSTTERDVDFLFRNNYEYTRSVIRYALARGIRLINASSAATYGDGSAGFDDDPAKLERLKPLNAYGYTKHLADLWAKRTGCQAAFVSLKFFNVYGPNEYHKGEMRSLVAKAFSQVNETGKVRLFASDRAEYPDGGQMRDFIYVKDCARVMWWLMRHPGVNGLFNLGTGKARTWNDLASALFSAMNREKNIEYIPLPEYLCGKYQYVTEASMRRLADAGCPVPRYSLEEGVADYVENYLGQADPYL